MTRGAGWFSPPKALARKRSPAAASRLADRRKSIVAPLESTARHPVIASSSTLIRRSEGNQGTLVAAVQEYPSELLPEHALDKVREGVRVKEVEQRSEGGNHRC